MRTAGAGGHGRAVSVVGGRGGGGARTDRAVATCRLGQIVKGDRSGCEVAQRTRPAFGQRCDVGGAPRRSGGRGKEAAAMVEARSWANASRSAYRLAGPAG
ncbi:MAG: hypothetical protein R2704_15110 [Microthrixaceae bacterium]